MSASIADTPHRPAASRVAVGCFGERAVQGPARPAMPLPLAAGLFGIASQNDAICPSAFQPARSAGIAAA